MQNPHDEIVRSISEKIDSYMRIVKKTTRDMVPKAITLYVIQELEAFIDRELLALIFTDSSDEYVSIQQIIFDGSWGSSRLNCSKPCAFIVMQISQVAKQIHCCIFVRTVGRLSVAELALYNCFFSRNNH